MIPSTLEVLEKDTFLECRRLSSVTFAEGSRLREIGPNCFANTGLKAFEAPPSLQKIGNRAFYCCGNLQYVVLNEGLEALGEDDEESCNEVGAFEYSGLKEIVFPGTLAKLTKNSFRYCYSLERVWVGQRCRARVADYVKSSVDVRVFREGDESILDGIRSKVRNGK